MAADAPVAALVRPPRGPTIPATRKGNGYDGMARHEGILELKDALSPDPLLSGRQPGNHAYRFGKLETALICWQNEP